MGIVSKIWRKRWILRALIPSIIFNFRHLPFGQACHLPILLYKATLLSNPGTFKIVGPVSFGMIRLGIYGVGIYPNNGIILENRGTIIFNGRTTIGNDSALSLGEHGLLSFGKNFAATCGLRLACYHSITFDENVLVGWNNLISDTDFHALKYLKSGGIASGYGPIHVGHDVWIANSCKIYKNVSIPHSCVIGADTILHKGVDCEPYSLITNKIETVVKIQGIFHDRNDDKINYKKSNEA